MVDLIIGSPASNPAIPNPVFLDAFGARPAKQARDLHLLRERAARSRTETWSRQDLEAVFGVGRSTAQNLMRAIGEVDSVAGAHFV